ncbi:MAG: carbonic anhydrase [Pirellulales bacterium]|nr:carbonic anhydrase [Pirellulales bacterium]
MLQELISGIHQFQHQIFAGERTFFEQLAEGQSPKVLFITCSDSRVNPNLITQTKPGDLFILRNIGNIVPPFTPNTADGATAAAVEYAVTQLNVDSIIVCGHSRCGAVEGLLNKEGLKTMPSVAGWLAHGESARRIVEENYKTLTNEQRLNIAVQENVLCQAENLRTHPAVAVRTSRGNLQIHAWVYKLETGQVFAYSPEVGQFTSVGECQPTPVNGRRLDAVAI